jgi:hypothetical protein
MEELISTGIEQACLLAEGVVSSVVVSWFAPVDDEQVPERHAMPVPERESMLAGQVGMAVPVRGAKSPLGVSGPSPFPPMQQTTAAKGLATMTMRPAGAMASTGDDLDWFPAGVTRSVRVA